MVPEYDILRLPLDLEVPKASAGTCEALPGMRTRLLSFRGARDITSAFLETFRLLPGPEEPGAHVLTIFHLTRPCPDRSAV